MADAQATQQGAGDPASVGGRWLPLHRMESTDPAVPVVARRAIALPLERILDVLRATPTLASPVGFDVIPSIAAEPGPWWVSDPDAVAYGHGPVRGVASVILAPLVRDESGGHVANAGEGPDITLRANDARCIFPGWKEPYVSDSLGPMFVEPSRTGDIHGHPVFLDYADEPCVVVTNRVAPLVIPVSRERLLHALIANDKATLAGMDEPRDRMLGMLQSAREMKASGNAAMRAQGEDMERRVLAALAEIDSPASGPAAGVRRRLASHERLLAAMSPAERHAPAVVRNFAMADDPFTSTPGAQEFRPTAIVAPNTAFFDRSRPISDIQLVTFHLACNTTGCSGWGNELRQKIFEEMDWKQLEAIVR